jgi:mono/diheme cytochrome c family protein
MSYFRGISTHLDKGPRLWVHVVSLGCAIVFLLLWNMTFHSAAQAPSEGSKPATAAKLYAHYCQRCHGANGKGTGYEGAPDFTNRTWQSKRSDAQMRVSILDGKGTDMPSFRERLDERQVKMLVARLRALTPMQAGTAKNVKTASFPSKNEEESFEKLQEHFENLQKQLKELNDAEAKKTTAENAAGKGKKIPIPAKAVLSGAALFQKHCQRCHGADGKGTECEGTPDFTDPAWQTKHSTIRLMVSILDGSKEMPSFRNKLSAAQARHLAAYLRAFQDLDEASPKETK